MQLIIGKKIDNGAYADVYEGTDELDRPIAIKIIRKSAGDHGFAIEQAKALARVSSPYVVRVFSVEDVKYPESTEIVTGILLEFVYGHTLRKAIAHGEIEVRRIHTLGQQMCYGLSSIHAAGIAHGDLHEDNILVTPDTVKIIDILYYDSLAIMSTKARSERLQGDVRSLRGMLRNLLSLQSGGIKSADNFADATATTISVDGLSEAFSRECAGSSSHDLIQKSAAGQNVYESDEPVVVWRLPRGFIVLDDLAPQTSASWSTTATYFGYPGEWRHGTHYHDSYQQRWDTPEGMQGQARKLLIHEDDKMYALPAIDLLMDFRHRNVSIDIDGNIVGKELSLEMTAGIVGVYRTGRVPEQSPPPSLKKSQMTGPIRDISQRLSEIRREGQNPKLVSSGEPAIYDKLKSIRRAVRIEASELFPPSKPALVNIEEVLSEFPKRLDLPSLLRWALDLEDAIDGAVSFAER